MNNFSVNMFANLLCKVLSNSTYLSPRQCNIINPKTTVNRMNKKLHRYTNTQVKHTQELMQVIPIIKF